MGEGSSAGVGRKGEEEGKGDVARPWRDLHPIEISREKICISSGQRSR